MKLYFLCVTIIILVLLTFSVRNELAFGELSNNTIAINATILKGAYTKSLLYFQNATLDLGRGNITMCPDNNTSSCHCEFENITLKNNNETTYRGFLKH